MAEEHSFDENTQKRWLKNNYQFQKVTWNTSNFKDILRYFSFDELMRSDTELLKWLLALNIEGIAIIEGVGTDESQLERLTKRIGFTKMTTYGKLYTVEAKENTTNAAYLAAPLELHVDLPYYDYIPSVNLLHFVKQSPKENEGINQLVDGIEICRQLKNFDESMYETLANTLVEWTDRGEDSIYEFYHIHRAPVICTDKNGNIIRLNVSQPQRDPHFCVSVKRANEWYAAMSWFIHLAHHPKNLKILKMKEGDLLSFDNTRILHGRSSFSTERKVVGAYMDWDIINSKIRILLSKLKLKDVEEVYRNTNTTRQEYNTSANI